MDLCCVQPTVEWLLTFLFCFKHKSDMFIFFLCLLYLFIYIIEASRGPAAQSVTVNRLVVGSIPTRGDEIFT